MLEQKLESEAVSIKILKIEASRCNHKGAFYGSYLDGISYNDIKAGNYIYLGSTYYQ